MAVVHCPVYIPFTAGSSEREAMTGKVDKDVILLQKVYGELVIFLCISQMRKCVMFFIVFSADHPKHLMLFRIHVSRTAADNGRAVLEGVGLLTDTIEPCFEDHPRNTEAAVQAGLTKWIEGKGLQPPTWEVLLDAMEYAQIGQQHIQDLKADLGLC